MTEKEILELLDKVLFLIKERGSVTYFDIENVAQGFNPKPEKGQLITIFRKLIKDGYIEKVGDRDEISIDGYVFAASGGYSALNTKKINEAILLQQEIDRRKVIDSQLEANSARLNKLTCWLAIGTIALAAFEAIKFILFLIDRCR